MQRWDFLGYALFTFVNPSTDSFQSSVNCNRSFRLPLAASLVLRSVLYCNHLFTTATWIVQKNSSALSCHRTVHTLFPVVVHTWKVP
ncbi:hypothetical protein T03_3197 [Trichinella britovi]|uniref:Uncharacterized protein n=1 Tax=Trichinella britovi TaxID=45882 RepID=A0A0V1CHJ9_TRIBR|nr:hypothetical protein T03_3197 [Trichinella britovi]